MQIAFGRVRRKTSPARESANVNIFSGFTIISIKHLLYSRDDRKEMEYLHRLYH